METEYVKCSFCGEELAEKTNFCPNCGAKNEHTITKCSSCGNVLTETDKFCPNCGAQRNRAEKNHLFKITLLFVLLTLLVVGVIVIMIGNIDNTTETLSTTPFILEATEQQILYEPNFDLLKSMVEDTIGSSFDFCGTSGDETNFYIGVATDGFADTIVTTQNAGYDENFELWVEVKGAMLEMYDSIYDGAILHGLHDIKITLMFLNDKNHDNAFLIIQDGIITYDVLAN